MSADLSGLHDLAASGPSPDAWAEYRAVIEAAITDHPRSQQVRIGPSELGTPCLLCLGRKLAGVPERREAAWLPTVGTAVHSWLEETFAVANAGQQHARYLTELRVDVGEVDGTAITGSCDLFDRVDASVNDWKVVGPTTLRKVRAQGPGDTYRTQAHLYGRGMTRRGLAVRTVRIVFLPRSEPTLAGAVIWSEPYDEAVAVAALTRADALAKAIRLASADAVLAGLAALPGCLSCTHYDDGRTASPVVPLPGHRLAPELAGLVGAVPGATATSATPGARAPAPVT